MLGPNILIPLNSLLIILLHIIFFFYNYLLLILILVIYHLSLFISFLIN